jgi:hypothetical protein
VRVRCTNTSVKPWRLRPGANAGVHASFVVQDAQDQCVAQGRAGLFHAVVPPGEAIDLTLAVGPLPGPGKYTMRVDMVDEQHGYFFQTGSDPLFVKLEAP